jgi:hypothetical protein
MLDEIAKFYIWVERNFLFPACTRKRGLVRERIFPFQMRDEIAKFYI